MNPSVIINALAYWKGRVLDCQSALESSKGTRFEHEYRNALAYAKYQVVRLEIRAFLRKSPSQREGTNL